MMATTKQVEAAKHNIKRAREVAEAKRTRQELYAEAKRRKVPGRSKMDRDELARALGRH